MIDIYNLRHALNSWYESSDLPEKIRLKLGKKIQKSFLHHWPDKRHLEYIKERLSGANKITVIIPVYNAPEATHRCVESVLRYTRCQYDLLLINDASPDISIVPILEKYAHFPHVKIIHHEQNQGFVRTVNEGMSLTQGDVVLLNSDTQVTEHWLPNLVTAAGSAPKIATVTPLSNAAGAFSVPEAGIENMIPIELGIDGMARLISNVSERVYPHIPTGNGFCLYVSREAISEIGLFDAETFLDGYCEENDFCMRALKAGWVHVIDDATFIYHERSASFGDHKKALIRENRKKLDDKYPDYTLRVKKFLTDPVIRSIRSRIHKALNTRPLAASKPHILYVMHQGGGGTPYTNMDLMEHVQKKYECFLLTSSARKMVLWKLRPGRKLVKYSSFRLPRRWQITDFYSDWLRSLYAAILMHLNVRNVHIRHLLGHSFDLPAITRFLGIKIILSFHDFYFVCPSIHLLDSESKYCGGNCSIQEKQCIYAENWLKITPHLSSFHAIWQKEVSILLENVDAFVTTTQSAKSVILNAYPQLEMRDFRIIEHGRDFLSLDKSSQARREPEPGKPIDILIPGKIGPNKGVKFLFALKEQDRENRLRLHFLGKGSRELAKIGIFHGSYIREEFFDKVRNIRPSFVGIFSIWPETYCHTLSEGWALGIPVIASDIGAIAERMRAHSGGWLVDYTDPESAYQQILAIAADKEAYSKVVQNVSRIRMRSTKEMAEDYLMLYQEIMKRQTVNSK